MHGNELVRTGIVFVNRTSCEPLRVAPDMVRISQSWRIGEPGMRGELFLQACENQCFAFVSFTSTVFLPSKFVEDLSTGRAVPEPKHPPETKTG